MSLADAGIKDHIVAVGYKKESIKKVLKRYKHLNFKFIDIKQYKTKGSSFSLFKASSYCLEYKKYYEMYGNMLARNKSPLGVSKKYLEKFLSI